VNDHYKFAKTLNVRKFLKRDDPPPAAAAGTDTSTTGPTGAGTNTTTDTESATDATTSTSETEAETDAATTTTATTDAETGAAEVGTASEDPTVAESECSEYVLYSILIHSGGMTGGHYYAFLRPFLGTQGGNTGNGGDGDGGVGGDAGRTAEDQATSGSMGGNDVDNGGEEDRRPKRPRQTSPPPADSNLRMRATTPPPNLRGGVFDNVQPNIVPEGEEEGPVPFKGVGRRLSSFTACDREKDAAKARRWRGDDDVEGGAARPKKTKSLKLRRRFDGRRVVAATSNSTEEDDSMGGGSSDSVGGGDGYIETGRLPSPTPSPRGERERGEIEEPSVDRWSEWVEFNDEQVSFVTESHVKRTSFGTNHNRDDDDADADEDYFNTGIETTRAASPPSDGGGYMGNASAYMLCYIKASEVETVMKDLGTHGIPADIQARFTNEKLARKERALAKMKQADMRTIKVVTDQSIAALKGAKKDSSGFVYDVFDLERARVIPAHKDILICDVQDIIAQHFGIPAPWQRLWRACRRKNNTHRAHDCFQSTEYLMTVDEQSEGKFDIVIAPPSLVRRDGGKWNILEGISLTREEHGKGNFRQMGWFMKVDDPDSWWCTLDRRFHISATEGVAFFISAIDHNEKHNDSENVAVVRNMLTETQLPFVLSLKPRVSSGIGSHATKDTAIQLFVEATPPSSGISTAVLDLWQVPTTDGDIAHAESETQSLLDESEPQGNGSGTGAMLTLKKWKDPMCTEQTMIPGAESPVMWRGEGGAAGRDFDFRAVPCPPTIDADHILVFWKYFAPNALDLDDRLTYIGSMVVPKEMPVCQAFSTLRTAVGLDADVPLKVEECISIHSQPDNLLKADSTFKACQLMNGDLLIFSVDIPTVDIGVEAEVQCMLDFDMSTPTVKLYYRLVQHAMDVHFQCLRHPGNDFLRMPAGTQTKYWPSNCIPSKALQDLLQRTPAIVTVRLFKNMTHEQMLDCLVAKLGIPRRDIIQLQKCTSYGSPGLKVSCTGQTDNGGNIDNAGQFFVECSDRIFFQFLEYPDAERNTLDAFVVKINVHHHLLAANTNTAAVAVATVVTTPVVHTDDAAVSKGSTYDHDCGHEIELSVGREDTVAEVIQSVVAKIAESLPGVAVCQDNFTIGSLCLYASCRDNGTALFKRDAAAGTLERWTNENGRSAIWLDAPIQNCPVPASHHLPLNNASHVSNHGGGGSEVPQYLITTLYAPGSMGGYLGNPVLCVMEGPPDTPLSIDFLAELARRCGLQAGTKALADWPAKMCLLLKNTKLPLLVKEETNVGDGDDGERGGKEEKEADVEMDAGADTTAVAKGEEASLPPLALWKAVVKIVETLPEATEVPPIPLVGIPVTHEIKEEFAQFCDCNHASWGRQDNSGDASRIPVSSNNGITIRGHYYNNASF
jgi:hypothetical protein